MKAYSVLMSVYAKENPQFLQKSLESMENQTVPCHDWVVVCDGPLPPDLNEVLHAYVRKYPRDFRLLALKENVGLGKALNVGLPVCKCEFIARMDSDDIAFPDRCEKQLKAFSVQQADIVSGEVLEFTDIPGDSVLSRKLPERHEEILRFAKRRNPFNHPCVMFRKSAVLSAGGYQSYYLCEDYYLWVRMLMRGMRGYNLQTPILYMRAGSAMYRRRAGMKYLKSMLSFRWMLKKWGFSGWGDFLISSGGQILTCLLSNKMREKGYGLLLRNRSEVIDLPYIKGRIGESDL